MTTRGHHGVLLGGAGAPPPAVITWNPLDKSPQITLSSGDLVASVAGPSFCESVRANVSKSSGKWYWEVETTTANPDTLIGIDNGGVPVDGVGPTGYPGGTAGSYAYYQPSGDKYNNNVSTPYGTAYTGTHIIGVAYDADAGKIWFRRDGVWQAGGDPVAGTGEAFSGIVGPQYPIVGLINNASVITGRFLKSSWALAAPAGFLPLDGDTSVVTDPYFANVTALLPMTSDFTDLIGNSWTANNGAVVSAQQGFFDGDAWIAAPSSANFGFGSGDYTVEGYFNPASISGNMCLLDTRDAAVEGISVYANAISLGGGFAFATNTMVLDAGATPTVNAVQHWAACREGTDVHCYLNGVHQFTVTDGRALGASTHCFIGDAYVAPLQPINGYIPGGVRVTKGICRYPGGTSFTPPSHFPLS